jgi:hypothetical protein
MIIFVFMAHLHKEALKFGMVISELFFFLEFFLIVFS